MNDFVFHGLIKWLQEMRRPVVRVLLGVLRALLGKPWDRRGIASSEMHQPRVQSMKRLGNRSRQVEEKFPLNRLAKFLTSLLWSTRSRTSAQDYKAQRSPPTCPCLFAR